MSYISFSPLTGTGAPELVTDPFLLADEHGEGKRFPAAHSSWSEAATQCWITQVMSLRAAGGVLPVANGTPPSRPDLFHLDSVAWSLTDSDWYEFFQLVPVDPGTDFTKDANPVEPSYSSFTKKYPCGTIAGTAAGSADVIAAPLQVVITVTWNYSLPRFRRSQPPLSAGERLWCEASVTISASVTTQDGFSSAEDNNIIGAMDYHYSSLYDASVDSQFTAMAIYVPWSAGTYLPETDDPPGGTAIGVPVAQLRLFPYDGTPESQFSLNKIYMAPVTTYGPRSL